jgi:hypothetical protein
MGRMIKKAAVITAGTAFSVMGIGFAVYSAEQFAEAGHPYPSEVTADARQAKLKGLLDVMPEDANARGELEQKLEDAEHEEAIDMVARQAKGDFAAVGVLAGVAAVALGAGGSVVISRE